jgi:DeoR family glycerol-3-phosphate regulon repressor
MKRDQRFKAILTLLDEKGYVEVEALAQHFDVSPETIRRDLSALSEQAQLRKVHGGAVKFQTAQETSFTMRRQHNLSEKAAIAEYASQFINPGDSLFLNGGTTTAIFASKIAQMFDNLVIITNSTLIANELWQNGKNGNQIFLLGGQYDGNEMDTTGTVVIDQIRKFQADHAILTVGTVSATQGFMDYRLEAGQIMCAMAQQAHQTTVIADSSKLGRAALITSCSLGDVHRVVSDRMPPGDLAEALDRVGTPLYVTDPVGERPV